jgi:glycosyltransferase involved in cell wall biosynthesis
VPWRASRGCGVRLALVGPVHPFRGGIAHYTSLLARHLRARHEVLLVSFARGYPRPLYPGRSDRDPSTDAVTEPAERILAPLRPWTWWRTADRIARFGPDLVLIQWWSPFWAPSLATVAALARWWTGAPVVFVCHNILPHEGAGMVTRALVRAALGRGQAFIVHSAADAERLDAVLPAAVRRGASVHRSVLPAHTIASPIDRSAARVALGLPADSAVALFFGFVRPYKGLAYLIDAIALSLPDLPTLHLVVAGEFWDPATSYRRRAADLGLSARVRFDDRYVPNEEVGRYFAASDVVVLPYVDASQSGVLTLASEFGLPAIATRVGGLPDAVIDGVTGVLVPPADARALADALVQVLGDRATAERLRAGVAAARGRFAWDGVVALIESLAARGGAPDRPAAARPDA